MTWIELVKRTAREFRCELNNEEADMVLWEFTGFPAFWHGDPVTCCTGQIRDFFVALLSGRDPWEERDVAMSRLCEANE